MSDIAESTKSKAVHDSLRDVSPEKLHAFLDLQSATVVWTNADLRLLWDQQLKAPLRQELASDGMELPALVDELCRSVAPALTDVGSLLRHPQVPMDLLDMARREAKKRSVASAGSGLECISHALYFALIAAMIKRGHSRPTALTPLELANGFKWTQGLPWLDAHSAELVQSAARLGG